MVPENKRLPFSLLFGHVYVPFVSTVLLWVREHGERSKTEILANNLDDLEKKWESQASVMVGTYKAKITKETKSGVEIEYDVIVHDMGLAFTIAVTTIVDHRNVFRQSDQGISQGKGLYTKSSDGTELLEL